MGESRRVLKVEKEVREIVGSFLSRDFLGRFPILVTVSRVCLNKDLRQGRVFVTMMGVDGGENDLEDEVIEALNKKSPEIQFEINRKLRMKFCPKLTFSVDQSIEKVLHIERVLHGLQKSTEQNIEKDE